MAVSDRNNHYFYTNWLKEGSSKKGLLKHSVRFICNRIYFVKYFAIYRRWNIKDGTKVFLKILCFGLHIPETMIKEIACKKPCHYHFWFSIMLTSRWICVFIKKQNTFCIFLNFRKRNRKVEDWNVYDM